MIREEPFNSEQFNTICSQIATAMGNIVIQLLVYTSLVTCITQSPCVCDLWIMWGKKDHWNLNNSFFRWVFFPFLHAVRAMHMQQMQQTICIVIWLRGSSITALFTQIMRLIAENAWLIMRYHLRCHLVYRSPLNDNHLFNPYDGVYGLTMWHWWQNWSEV